MENTKNLEENTSEDIETKISDSPVPLKVNELERATGAPDVDNNPPV